MRFIVYGVGAIGGTFAAALGQAGYPVIGIARGRMLDAIKADGLRFRTVSRDERIPLQVVASPADIAFAPDDVILLTMKSQDTADAVLALRDAGVTDQAVICAQNGINNERLALRYFANTYAMTVMIPADYVVPGEVVCFSRPRYGILDLGRYAAGLDATVSSLAAAFEAANFAVFPMDRVLKSKHGKLLENLGNIVEAALAPGSKAPDVYAAVRAEAEAVYRAAGIAEWIEIGGGEQRRVGVLEMGRVEGVVRTGGSSTQSLKRNAGSIETDYLNGEIVLLGRLHGVPAPLNEALCALSQDLVDRGAGGLSAEDLRRRLGLP